MALWSRMLTLCLLCIANAVAGQNVSAQSTAAAAAIARNSHREAGTKPAADSSGSAEKPEVSLNQLINDNTASDKQTTLAPPSNNAAVAGNTTGNVSSPHIGDSPSAPVAAANAGLSITVASVAMVTGSANGSESVTRPPPRPVVPTSSSPVSSSQPAAAPPAPVDTAPITSNNASSSEETDDVLPEAGAAEEEHLNSMSIFLVLAIIGLCILMIHFMISSKLRFLPESVAVVFLGALVGLVLKILSKSNIAHWQREEAFSPTVFFLVILPPIIFESGYNLHKGNFFQNFGTILLFAVFGTTISALVVGGGVYVLGMADVAYRLSFVESFAFGSLISAVDPVATLAIFNALDIDPVLSMLVFGESILNDAVAIVLTTTALESGMSPSTSAAPVGDVTSGSGGGVVAAVMRFCVVFGASAALGTVSALLAALLFKHVQLRSNPSLEFAMMLIFIYAPYGLAEGVHLSGIMAILFCGVVMSHYTHFNLSPVTQITMQQTMRSLAFVAETCVFAYLGLAIFSFRHAFEPALVFWSLTLCLVGRALNIFPLSWLANHFREHKITTNMQFIMWFSGLRGAIAYALCLHLEFASTTRHVLVTNTLIIILTTILVLGGATKPLLHYLQADKFTNARGRRGRVQRPRRRQRSCRRSSDDFNLSKTHELGTAIDSEYFSEMTEEDEQQDLVGDRQLRDAPMGDRQLRDAPMGDRQLRDGAMGDRQLRDGAAGDRQLRGFARLDFFYLQPFFTRRLTQNEMRAAQLQMSAITDRAYQDIRVSPCDHSDPQDAVIGSDLDQDQSCDDSDQRRLLV